MQDAKCETSRYLNFCLPFADMIISSSTATGALKYSNLNHTLFVTANLKYNINFQVQWNTLTIHIEKHHK